MVGGAIWSRIAITQMPASTPPAPPSKCPVMDLVELTATFLACSPKHADGNRLHPISQRRGRAVRVDVVDLVRLQLGVFHGQFHHPVRSVAVFRR